MTSCLIVDDSNTIRKIARSIMEKLGLECREAENGLIALEKCSEQMPDIVLLDWNMPVMNGLEFLIELRAREGGKTPKVLFCTTENSFDFIQKGMAAGADEYIMKPFDKDIMASKLSQLGLIDQD